MLYGQSERRRDATVRAIAQIDKKQIDNMELEISFRMKVSDWRRLMGDQDASWPSSDVARHIAGVLEHVNKATATTFSEGYSETSQ